MKFICFFALLLTVPSCSHFGEMVSNLLIDQGVLKTAKNQNYSKILKEGRFILTGIIKVYINGKDLTDYCWVGFNSNRNRRGMVFDNNREGEMLVDVEKKQNFFGVIGCDKTEEFSSFTYTFKSIPIKQSAKVSSIGEIKIYMTNEEIDDDYALYPKVGPWVTKIEYRSDGNLQLFEEKYGVSIEEVLDLEFGE